MLSRLRMMDVPRRVLIAVVVWGLIRVLDLDEPLPWLDNESVEALLEAILAVMWVIWVLGGPVLAPALAHSFQRTKHQLRTWHHPAPLRSDPINPPRPGASSDILVAALRSVVSDERHDEYLRDQICFVLHRDHGWSFRRLADIVGRDQTTVREHFLRTIPAPDLDGLLPRERRILTPEIPDWRVAQPPQILEYLGRYNPGSQPVPNEELDSLVALAWTRMESFTIHPPDHVWLADRVRDFTRRAQSERNRLRQMDVLAATQAMMIAAAFRFDSTGQDGANDIRHRWLEALARLAVELE